MIYYLNKATYPIQTTTRPSGGLGAPNGKGNGKAALVVHGLLGRRLPPSIYLKPIQNFHKHPKASKKLCYAFELMLRHPRRGQFAPQLTQFFATRFSL